jgi:NAD(P)-dependent dehydrogenase (short-subunit alcohol dehydrogenase family)
MTAKAVEPAPPDLAGQVALVTGAGRGIGKAIAESLAAAGARVALTARSVDELDATVRNIQAVHDDLARAFPADVTHRAAVEAVVGEVERSLGLITLLVNNAGVLGPIGEVWEVDADDWWHCLEVNLRGPFLCTRAVLRGMVARRRGRIVNVASSAALFPIADGTAYGSSKTALVRFTESVARETEALGISVFALDPGNVPTGMHEFLASSPAWLKRRGSHDPAFTPAHRTADLVARLASGYADALTGRLLNVNDDVDTLVRRAESIRQEDLYTLRLRQ